MVVMVEGWPELGGVLTGVAAVITATAQLIRVLRRDKGDRETK